MPTQKPMEIISDLFDSNTVVNMQQIKSALGEVSSMTVFRHLRQMSYRRSYNHNGRFYTKYDPSHYDHLGLCSYGTIRFSIDGTLIKTVKRLVLEAEAGSTHQELSNCLRIRVHNTLYNLLKKNQIDREKVLSIYVYLHPSLKVQELQLNMRKELIDQAVASNFTVGDDIIIQVLLTLIRHPGSAATDVMRYLQGHSPPITIQHIRFVFSMYELDSIEEKKGL